MAVDQTREECAAAAVYYPVGRKRGRRRRWAAPLDPCTVDEDGRVRGRFGTCRREERDVPDQECGQCRHLAGGFRQVEVLDSPIRGSTLQAETRSPSRRSVLSGRGASTPFPADLILLSVGLLQMGRCVLYMTAHGVLCSDRIVIAQCL